VLTVYDRATATHRNYIPAPDRCLRESLQLNSPRLQAFYHPCDGRHEVHCLNVFLVIINAGIKFRRYIQMISTNPPAISLPTDVLTLMNRTNKLVELLYWKPIPTKGSRGEMEFARKFAARQQNPEGSRRPSREKNIEGESSEEMETADGEDTVTEEDAQNPSHNLATSKRRKKFHWPAGMDLEARIAYGSALMSGHGVLHFLSLSPIVRTDCLRRP
jgi:hypothetical protein